MIHRTESSMTDDKKTAHYEKYVVNIDIAKRLKVCGFAAPTMFYWIDNPQLGTVCLYRTGVDMDYLGPAEHKVPAPTAFEIKELLPDEVWITTKSKSLIRREGQFYFTKYQGRYIVSLMIKSVDTAQIYELHREEDSSEANACGRMYCYIYENHLHELHS
jgi:hypothetical protein